MVKRPGNMEDYKMELESMLYEDPEAPMREVGSSEHEAYKVLVVAEIAKAVALSTDIRAALQAYLAARETGEESIIDHAIAVFDDLIDGVESALGINIIPQGIPGGHHDPKVVRGLSPTNVHMKGGVVITPADVQHLV